MKDEKKGELKSPLDKGQNGKGVDIGTVFVKSAQREGDKIVLKTQRNAFFEVERTDFTRNMLENSKVKYVQEKERLYVVGDDALELANIFHKEARRPLNQGIISPTEEEALPMVELLIKSVVGEPKNDGEIVYYSIPGEPLDADLNIVYHKKILHDFLAKLGYTPKTINEAYAVILSELANEGFTGVGISFGGGLVNVCLSFVSIPIFNFSLIKAGDWIDQQVAMTANETAARICAIKESSLDLIKREGLTKIEAALSVYYEHLIEYVIENIKDVFEKSEKKPWIDKPISIILSGGTSLPKGFVERFQRTLERLGFPLEVGSVRTASQPLTSVAKGALIAVNADESRMH